MNINFNIILCGFMGAGKTTIGKQLSNSTGLNFIDTDNYIENKYKLTINEIFNKYGEAYFRKIEKSCISEVASNTNCIISTGGGAVLDNDNVLSLKSNGKLILLDLPCDIIISRLIKNTTRPLIKNNNINSIKKLYTLRKEKYLSAADIIINANQSINNICTDIMDKICVN